MFPVDAPVVLHLQQMAACDAVGAVKTKKTTNEDVETIFLNNPR
jgi:hypothetical protein